MLFFLPIYQYTDAKLIMKTSSIREKKMQLFQSIRRLSHLCAYVCIILKKKNKKKNTKVQWSAACERQRWCLCGFCIDVCGLVQCESLRETTVLSFCQLYFVGIRENPFGRSLVPGFIYLTASRFRILVCFFKSFFFSRILFCILYIYWLPPRYQRHETLIHALFFTYIK